MSITTSLSNALSGLTAASRAAELVSNNVANAMTEGYGRREISLGARNLGGAGAGVQVQGVTRAVDEAVIGDRRLADAALAERQSLSTALDALGRLLGTPDDPASVTGRIAAFEGAITDAVSRPDSPTRLDAVLASAIALAESVNAVSDGIRDQRMEADADIARQVGALNDGLAQIDEINRSIVSLGGAGRDVTALLDQRQQAIDRISGIVPLRTIPRDDGAVALYTVSGAALLDGRVGEIGFVPAGIITADMSLASGALSGLTINGRPVSTEGPYAPLGGGSLGAAIHIRDVLAPETQSLVDALAVELVTRFEDPALDASRPPGAPGLFTDAGAALDPANETGLSDRLSVNAAVDPSRGGETWRLRDGLGATVPGPVGEASLLGRMADVLAVRQPPRSAAAPVQAFSLSSLAAEIHSRLSRDGLEAEQALGYATTRQQGLAGLEQRGGVDTDQEMQKLLLIETAYAANARVIQVIDDLIGRLLEI